MEWQPIETAPKGEWLIGLAFGGSSAPAFVGELYDARLSGGPALINRMTGRWVRVSHWMPIPLAPTTPTKGASE